MFRRRDFDRLAEILSAISGRFILSINDTPAVRRIFGRFEIDQVETTYTAAGQGNEKRVSELIIASPAPANDGFDLF